MKKKSILFALAAVCLPSVSYTHLGDSLPLQIPVVFFGIKYPDMELIATHPNVCGFTANPDFDVILRQAQKIFPQRNEVVCVAIKMCIRDSLIYCTMNLVSIP